MIVWQDFMAIGFILLVLFTAWVEAHPAPPEEPDYLSTFHYFAYRA